jgi:hypothetical protein
MNHRKDTAEEQAIMLLTKVIEISERDRDALPGSAVKLVKAARRIMLKRRKSKRGRLLALSPFGEVAAFDGGRHQVTERIGGAGEGGDAQLG